MPSRAAHNSARFVSFSENEMYTRCCCYKKKKKKKEKPVRRDKMNARSLRTPRDIYTGQFLKPSKNSATEICRSGDA